MRTTADSLEIRKKSDDLMRELGVDSGVVKKVEDCACHGRGGRVRPYGIDALDGVTATLRILRQLYLL